MVLIRCLLIVMLMLSATFSVAMEAGHAANFDSERTVAETMSDDMPACCDDSTERGQTCHVLLALLPGAEGYSMGPITGEDVFAAAGLLLSGIEPSGPLDPPRVM
ncbi:MAG: hypothetical protein ABJO71_01480 [Pseudoruegeria sp.]